MAKIKRKRTRKVIGKRPYWADDALKPNPTYGLVPHVPLRDLWGYTGDPQRDCDRNYWEFEDDV